MKTHNDKAEHEHERERECEPEHIREYTANNVYPSIYPSIMIDPYGDVLCISSPLEETRTNLMPIASYVLNFVDFEILHDVKL